MVTRNLTDAFILMRNNALQSRHIFAEQNHDDRVALVSEDLEKGLGLRESGPPRWIDSLDEINYQMTKIRKKLKELSALHDKHLNRPTFDESTTEEEEIEQTTQDITRLFTHCQQLLTEIHRDNYASSHKEKKLAQNVVCSVANSLQSLTGSFRASQSAYCKRLQSREEHSNKFFDVPYFEETPASPDNFSKQLSQDQLLLIEDNTAHVEMREIEIKKIVRSITELNTIFKDLASMVADQGSVLDRIDYNIDQVQTKVHQGLQQLQKAESYQKKNHKMMCIMVLAATTIFLIILLFALKL